MLAEVTGWGAAPDDVRLDDSSLHVWRAGLRPPPGVVGELRTLLDVAEADRAARFRFDPDRHAFVCARAALRLLVGRYLGVEARSVRFGYTDKGKPYVAGGPLSFNVSHAGDVALLAFTRAAPVGVDVEVVRADVEVTALARRFFTVGENAALADLQGDRRVRGFYDCWTRKEAFVKAVGEGLSFPLDDVEVTLSPGEAPRIVSLRGGDPAEWSLLSLDAGPSYAAAVAVEARDVAMSCWDVPLEPAP